MIRKLKSGEYRLYSRKPNPKTGRRRNLGTFKSRARPRSTNATCSISSGIDDAALRASSLALLVVTIEKSAPELQRAVLSPTG